MRKLFFFIIAAICSFAVCLQHLHRQTVMLPAPDTNSSLLLVPLDSRPVCSSMVQKLGRLAGINVILPPKELLDNYQKPAPKEKLWQWLLQKAPHYPASIVSTDILLHGSLLQTRQHLASHEEQTQFFANLQQLQSHSVQPQLFSVIPRLLVSDELLPDRWYQYHLMRYSQLADMTEINNDYAMTAKLLEYQKEIPAKILNKYTNIYQSSYSFNTRLVQAVQSEAASSKNAAAPQLIIGQDDSSPFGLPHRSAQQLQSQIERRHLQNRVQLTYGADEIAALLLAQQVLQQQHWQPRVYLHYGLQKTEYKHMPYMAVSTGTALRNQLQLLGAQECTSEAAADLVLYIHCGDDNALPSRKEAQELRQLLEQNKKIALIDLSANFEAEEMLLPLLLQENVPINRLTAYAGWNTFSNSSGTALAQALIFGCRLRELEQSSQADAQQLAALYRDNLCFTAERMLEDYYYQKLVHPQLRPYLESFGITPADLSAEDKQQTEAYIQKRLSLYADWLLWRSLSNTHFFSYDGRDYYVSNLTVGSRLPWNRIFEVELHTGLQIEERPSTK